MSLTLRKHSEVVVRLGLIRAEALMPCKWCQSDAQTIFNGEIAIHFPGLQGLDKPIVWVFPKLAVCLDCGFAEFLVPESELRLLSEGTAANRAAAGR